MICGPFDILGPIAEGGMGAVFRARHRHDGTRAAVKVIRDQPDQAEKRRRFLREVLWLARLDHPNIATIYDFGIADADSVDPDFLSPGAPWLAMEFVAGDSSKEHFGRWDWSQLRDFLTGVLDGLAHAHARQVVHRDLKPANVLVDTTAQHVHVKLVDFGIATAMQAEDTGSAAQDPIHGTPNYMAPEQVLNRTNWLGPWTDIYALGCLAWRAVCGKAPFDAEDSTDILVGQVRDDPGEFVPRIDVPAGLERWLRRALQKHPHRRFRRAADAAWALARLNVDQMVAGRGTDITTSASMTWTGPTLAALGETTEFRQGASSDAETLLRDIDDSTRAGDGSGIFGVGGSTVSLLPSAPPFPDTWRSGDEDLVALPLAESGLELFALRELPMVARERERDELWELLREVCQDGALRAVVLHGDRGSGKSRLARWLCERAHEVGAAVPMEATHSRLFERVDGLGPMFARYLRLRDEPWERAHPMMLERLEELGIDEDRRQAYAFGLGGMLGLRPEDPAERAALGFSTVEERHHALLDIMQAIGRERPVVLFLDDVHWGLDSLEFVEFLLSHRDQAPPTLVAMTARSSELQRESRCVALLEDVQERPEVQVERVEPLPMEQLRTLVESMLSFHPEVVENIVQRAEGHPLFAIQLVEDWVERGVLVSEEGAFRPDPNAEIELPATLDAIWRRRLESLIDRLAGTDQTRRQLLDLLQVAAALGQHVDEEEWRLAATAAGIWDENHLPLALADAGLAVPTGGGWRFSHRLLWESVCQWARDEGRWGRWLRACAQAMESRAGEDRSGRFALRQAEYLLEAGAVEDALWPLNRAILRFRQTGNSGWRDLALRRSRLIEEIGIGPSSRYYIQDLIERAMMAGREFRTEDERELLDEAEALARREGFDLELARALQDRAVLLRRTGDTNASLACLAEAEEILEELDAPEELIRVLGNRATNLLHLGKPRESRELLERILEQGLERGLTNIVVRAHSMIGWTWMEHGDTERALQAGRDALEAARKYGHRAVEGSVCGLLGDACKELGRFDEARQWNEAAIDCFEVMGRQGAVVISRLNIVMADMLCGDFEGVEDRLHELHDQVLESGSTARIRFFHVCEMARAAHDGDARGARESLDALVSELSESEISMRDIPLMAELAAKYAVEQDLGAVRTEIVELSERLWNQHGDPERAREVARMGAASN